MALGKLLEGAAWFATLSLATVGTLAFLPDGAWETFPTALRPARAKLAELGVAPMCYRADVNAENVDEREKETADSSDAAKTASIQDAWTASTEIKIGERWPKGRAIDETVWADRRIGNGASEVNLEGETRRRDSGAEASAGIERVETPIDANGLPLTNATPWGSEANVAATTENASEAESWEDDAIPPFVENVELPSDVNGQNVVANVENGTAVLGGEGVATADVLGETGVGAGALGGTSAGTGEIADVASVAAPINAAPTNGFSDFNGLDGADNLNAAPEGGAGLLEQADAALPNDLNVGASVANATPVDEAAELRDALAAASTASTPEEIKTVFETLNRIRNERGRRLAAEDSQALDAALDRLAFDVFYNPAQTILEPRWQTAPGETLASIAERLETTPETLAEINGIKTPVDAPLPVGTTLKTARGPVSAEISIAKKELTLRFNGLYAGRFALGVPENSANLRGDFRVVEKLANPNCDAVDANGQTISIPGGAPENPLGVAWIALDGGVGLQGTNRPELVGQTIAENGGFVFSNREIAQLSVLLPVGAVVAIVD